MERIIALTASLPHNSKMREKLTQTLVGTLWESLQHPPLSYYGDQHQYRTADGSYNVTSVLQNMLGPSLINQFRIFYFQTLAKQERLTRRAVVLSKLFTEPSPTQVSYSIVSSASRPNRAHSFDQQLIHLEVLMARPDGKFAKNPAGINSMLFYHATIIIHGIDPEAFQFESL